MSDQGNLQIRDNRQLGTNTGTLVAGGFSGLLGLVVLVGWHSHTGALIQLHPMLVPMQYNTAIGFSVKRPDVVGAWA